MAQNDHNEIIPNNEETSTLLKIIKWIGFSLITIAGLILVLNSFIHMFSLSLFLSSMLILACIIFDMALFENSRRILKLILECIHRILCRYRQNDGAIKIINEGQNQNLIFNYTSKQKTSNHNDATRPGGQFRFNKRNNN